MKFSENHFSFNITIILYGKAHWRILLIFCGIEVLIEKK